MITEPIGAHMQDRMEQKEPGFQTRVALERFEHVRDASFTSDGKGVWAPVRGTSSSLWDAETGRTIFAPALPDAAKSLASALTDEAPTAGLAQSRILFREEQARTFSETATALLEKHRSSSFRWSLKLSSRADPPTPPKWRASMPYRFLFAADEQLLLIEEVKDYLPEALLVDLETGEDIARIKAGKLTVSSNAARLQEGLWFSESHPGTHPRALFITATALQDAHRLVSGEVTALLRSVDSGTLIIGTDQGELYSCKKGNPAPVLIGSVPKGPVKAIRTGAGGRLIIATDGTVSFLSPGAGEGGIQTHEGDVGDISADATLAAIVTPNDLSIVETPTGTLAWRVRKSFDRILFSCDGSSVYCMNTGDRSPALEEFDALAGLPLDPPADNKFKDALACQKLKRFGEDEYITASSRPDPFRWISGAGIKAESCHRGFPGKDFKMISSWRGSFCYPGVNAKTYALDGDGKLQICRQTGDIRTIGLSGLSTGDLDVVFGPEDRVAIIARIDGKVVCHDTISGEQRWKIPRPVIRKIPSRTISSVLFMDSHLNVLEHKLQRLSTLEVFSESLRHAELSEKPPRVLTLGQDGAVNLWDTCTGKSISELRGKADIRQARFSSCGHFFATADAEGLLTLYRSEEVKPLWQAATGHNDISAIIPLAGDESIRILAGNHVETWHRERGAGISSAATRVDATLSVNGWPLRFITDLVWLLDVDEVALATISSNGIASDGTRPLLLQNNPQGPVRIHVPYGHLRTVHRKLRPGLEDLRVREYHKYGLPVWRNAATALSAHSGAATTVSVRIGAYAERLLFGRVLAWMKTGPLQMGDDAATLLSRTLTRSDHLAIHTRTAALLGELMTLDLTRRLTDLACNHGVRITRFSDRIFISGDEVPAGIGSFARTHKEDIFIPGRLLSHAVLRSGFRLEPYGEVRGRISEPA